MDPAAAATSNNTKSYLYQHLFIIASVPAYSFFPSSELALALPYRIQSSRVFLSDQKSISYNLELP